MKIVKSGYIQFEPILGQEHKNIQTLIPLFEIGKEADLLVLPELPNSGYNFNSKEEAWTCANEVTKSIYVDFIKDVAQKNNQYIATGFCEKENDKLYNSSLLVGPEGIIGKYRKIHLFWNEKDIFEPGNMGLPIFDLKIGRIGMLICFDWAFPEVWRILGLKGVEIVCHPSNLVLPYAQQAIPVHSLINRYFTITANRFGKERGITFSGGSIIATPGGKIVKKAKSNEEAVHYEEIDFTVAKDKYLTPRNHVFNDRIPDAYKELLDFSYQSES